MLPMLSSQWESNKRIGSLGVTVHVDTLSLVYYVRPTLEFIRSPKMVIMYCIKIAQTILTVHVPLITITIFLKSCGNCNCIHRKVGKWNLFSLVIVYWNQSYFQ